MSSKYIGHDMHMIRPETPGKVDLGPQGSLFMPEFTTAREFADKKIKMLKEQMCIHITKDEALHLRSLKTEGEINAAVRAIINKYWG